MKQISIFFRDRSFWIGLLIVCTFLFIFGRSAFSTIYYSNPHFDDAYNATVSANLMRHGEYRVSYPDHIAFHNKITTGVPMLLPLAYIYQWFGISTFTTEFQSVIYGLLNIVLIWLLLGICFKRYTRYGYLIAAFLALMIPLSNRIYYIISVNLIGEIAAICYMLISVICWHLYARRSRPAYLLVSGAMLAIAFLTKSAMIFFVVSCFGIIFIETFLSKQLSRRALMFWICGFIIGFALVDGYKCYKLGGAHQYINWWIAEWHNMIDQSDGHYRPSLFAKFNYLETEFFCNKFLAFAIILLAPLPYCYCLYQNWIKKKPVAAELKTLGIVGITGDSLLVYSFLFGKSGLMHVKRLIVNTVFVKVLFVFCLGLLLLYLVRAFKAYYSSRHRQDLVKSLISSVLFVVLLCLFFPKEKIEANLKMYTTVLTEKISTQIRMEQLLDEISKLPSDVPLYTDSWFQEPCVSLFLDRDMISYKDVISGKKELDTNGYFLVGYTPLYRTKRQIEEELHVKFVPADTIWVENYEIHTGILDPERENFVQMTKYKIIPVTAEN